MKQEALRFKRHFPIGPYVVDFCCTAAKLVIEVNRKKPGASVAADSYDQMRQSYLESLGFKVLSFNEEDALSQPESISLAIRICLNGSN